MNDVYDHDAATFKIGDTAECKINGKPERLTWRDAETLVIEPDDVHTIEYGERAISKEFGEYYTFMCD